MKTSNFIKFWLAIFVGLSFIACGGSDNSKKSAGTPIGSALGAAPCSGCNWGATGGAALFQASAYGSYSFPMAMTVAVSGDAMQMQQLMAMQMYPAKTYSGQAALQGALSVNQQIYAGNCILIPGTYQMVNASVGTYSGGTFTFSQFEMVNGGYRYLMALQGVIIDQNSDGQPEGFGGQLYVLQGPSYYGTLGSCMDGVGFTLAP